jgi:polysaccharide export outer membrane protein
MVRSAGRSADRFAGKALVSAMGVLMAAGLTGCSNWDSFGNPSVVGRWERTPTRVPILTHLAAIEDEQEKWVERTEITPEDLQAQADPYRVGAGDILSMTIWDLVARNAAEQVVRQVDQNGYVEIPVLGRVFVSGLTEPEVAQAIAERMQNIVADPLVSVVVEQRRQQLFFLSGAIAGAGPYAVPSADYRLLEALATAGGVPEFIDELYVIRQIPLTDAGGRMSPENEGDRFRGTPEPQRQQDGESLLNVIEELSAPGALPGAMGGVVPAIVQPERDEPLIDLIETPRPTEPAQTVPDAAEVPERSLEPRWRYRDGRWTRESIPAATRRPIADRQTGGPRDLRGDLFTQRVIRVPTKPLAAGDARYNIVVRPGDVVHIPSNEIGVFYMGGQVNRPGVYNLPQVGKMTLVRAIVSASDLGPLAIPERVDLTRMVGPDEQATIMLDYRAIREGTQPDVYIRRDDVINIGTNFWATPLAVVRGGFRTSYGFGFLLDRNFGNDVFGAPPSNNAFGN